MANEWQPIETAPKNGAKMVLYDPQWSETGEQYEIGWWGKRAATGTEGWTNHIADEYGYVINPSHWQPLEPPNGN